MAIVSTNSDYFYTYKVDFIADTLTELQNNYATYIGKVVFVKDQNTTFSVFEPISNELSNLVDLKFSIRDISVSSVDHYYMTASGMQVTSDIIEFFSPVYVNSVGIIGGITGTAGVGTIYVNSTGLNGGVPLFENFDNCDIQLTAFATGSGYGDAFVTSIINNYSNTTGLLRILARQPEGFFGGSAAPNGLRINCRIIGKKNPNY